MVHRLEIMQTIPDTRAKVRREELLSDKSLQTINDVRLVDVYTVDTKLDLGDIKKILPAMVNPVFQQGEVDTPLSPKHFDYAVEIGFLPGVTDNVGNTARENISDLLGKSFNGQLVYSSQVMFLSGNISNDDAQKIGEAVANPLIQRIQVKGYEEFHKQGGMGVIVPSVNIREHPQAGLVKIINAGEDELITIGKKGIRNDDGSRRGPLSLVGVRYDMNGLPSVDIRYMNAIKSHFKEKGRNPTDVELESIAQTWSEHCKHTIFADPIDEFSHGLYKTFIQGATNVIRKNKGKEDFCVSVFTDNAGAIEFDETYLVADKVETHNSPSALDPFGGSITGIVGVNRDAMGFGLGAMPTINRFGFCFGSPSDTEPLYKGRGKTQKMLSPRRIMDGVIGGVNVGGNCSGIPTPQGFLYFDDRFKGKPLVFVGTVGLIPREKNGRLLHEKKANPGDYIVMAGGRVGKDGIHGATFSSEAMDTGSPATAVQIGDPITQKKMSDAIVKEARDKNLYTSITDNGAGGLSCSVAEMAKESGGFYVNLEKVPLKYPGLSPWETWISESQERMTLSVPKDRWTEFSELMKRRGVEASRIGEFTDSGKCVVDYEGNNVMDMDMKFLHDGLPPRPMKTTFTKGTHEEPQLSLEENLTGSLHTMLARQNIASFEFISQQYDHEVQGGSVIKPLQGKGRVNGDATVTKPVLDSPKGVVISQGLNPSYSDIDTYHMAAAAIDTAVRNAVATGASLEHLALLDNFCWCSSDDPERLGQLKRAVEACYDTAVSYQTPFISGKDSMFNDFKGYSEDDTPIKISVPPTLLVSSIGVMQDATKAVSLDAKFPGDLVYVLGGTYNELGGSEYFAMIGEHLRRERFIGNTVPKVEPNINRELYTGLSNAIDRQLVASSQSVHRGGLGVALAKTAMGGRLGLEISIDDIPGRAIRNDYTLFSESQGRVVVTIDSSKANEFESVMDESMYARVGTVRSDDKFMIHDNNSLIIDTTVHGMLQSYKSTFSKF